MKKLALFLLILSTFAQADVWKSTQKWNLDWEAKFSKWISSQSVYPEMFSDKRSPYYGAVLDCADAAYALRAIFSFENSLPFAVESLRGARNYKDLLTSNESNKFDRTKDPHERVIKMINHIADSVGTENLSHYDSYPIKIASIKPGDFFMYKIKGRFGKTIRHTYNIKKINFEGTFQVIYSTQAIAKDKSPMSFRKHKVFHNLPHDVWGFRRMKWPSLIGLNISDYPKELGASQEQYELAKSLGHKKFFEYVRNTLKKGDLNVNDELNNRFDALCEEAQARVKYVDQAIAFMSKHGHKCMNYRNYDAYSTPARDKQLISTFNEYYDFYESLVDNGNAQYLTAENKKKIQEIFEGLNTQNDSLLKSCPVRYKKGLAINLKTLLERYRSGKVSSHPNDTLGARWGEEGNRTSCKVWYAPMMLSPVEFL